MEVTLVEIAVAIIILTGATKLFVPRKYTILVTIFWGILALIYYSLDPVMLITAVATSAGVHTLGNGIKREDEKGEVQDIDDVLLQQKNTN